MLIAEDEQRIRINSSVSNGYTFLHDHLKGVEFYATRLYVHLKNKGIEEYFFVSDEE